VPSHHHYATTEQRNPARSMTSRARPPRPGPATAAWS